MNISVVIPAYNAERFLGETLDSVTRQSLPVGQVVVVDDGSRDGTAGVAEAFGAPVELLRQSNAGQPAALNAGLARVRGDWIAFCDADDLWSADKLAVQGAWLARQPELDGVLGWVEQFGAGPPTVMKGAHRGALLIRRAAVERIGPFREDLKVGEFLDWYSRAQDAGVRLEAVPQVVYRRRIHDDNLGLRTQGEERKDFLKVLKAHLDRKRQSGP